MQDHNKSDAGKRDFWIRIMEQLNTNRDLYQPIPEILKDLCEFFEFGCGFVYQADHQNTFYLREDFSLYPNNHLRQSFDPKDFLTASLQKELSEQTVVIVRASIEKSPLTQRLCELFSAESLILVPITDQNCHLIALLGVADRRGNSRMEEEEDLSFIHAVLCALANHVKLQLYQIRIEATQKSLETIMDNMGVDIYVNDFHTHEILYVNRSMAEPYGGISNMLGKICWQTLYNDKTEACDYCPQKKLIDGEGNPTKMYSWDYQRPFDGAWFRVLSAAFRWVDGRLAHVVSSVDITENKKNEEIILRIAEYDTLTTLPNRRKLIADCKEYIQNNTPGYLLFFDLDGFKAINDSLGHSAGDDLLTQIGRVLQEHHLTRDNSYRYGGDEFVVLCPDISLSELKKTIDQLLRVFSKNWRLSDHTVCCRASIGVAHFPKDALSVSDLLNHADHAMYVAKREERGSVRFFNCGNICTSSEYFTHLSRSTAESF